MMGTPLDALRDELASARSELAELRAEVERLRAAQLQLGCAVPYQPYPWANGGAGGALPFIVDLNAARPWQFPSAMAAPGCAAPAPVMTFTAGA
jgi:hypothetical protein